jgi:hypothetical protein
MKNFIKENWLLAIGALLFNIAIVCYFYKNEQVSNNNTVESHVICIRTENGSLVMPVASVEEPEAQVICIRTEKGDLVLPLHK